MDIPFDPFVPRVKPAEYETLLIQNFPMAKPYSVVVQEVTC